MDVSFEILGQPIGYYAAGRFPNRGRLMQYYGFQERVRKAGKKAGLALPLESSFEKPIYICVLCFFDDKRHSDTTNVQKGVCDALFYNKSRQKGHGDKFTGGAFASPDYDQQNPRVMIRVADYSFIKLIPPR